MYQRDPKKVSYKYPAGMDSKGKAYKVLIVGDEEIPRRLVSRILRSVSYEVCGEAEDGIRAIEMHKQHKPDIVTMDVQMPQMNGTVALAKIRQIDPEAVVVMMTSVAEKEVVVEILRNGAKGYIVKPVQRDTVLEKLEAVRRPFAGRSAKKSDYRRLWRLFLNPGFSCRDVHDEIPHELHELPDRGGRLFEIVQNVTLVDL